jgi:hypothetical protein
MAAPRRNPIAASFAVKSAASQSTSIRSGPFVRDGSKSWPTISCRRHRQIGHGEGAESKLGRLAEP